MLSQNPPPLLRQLLPKPSSYTAYCTSYSLLCVVGLERQMWWDEREDQSRPQLLPHQNYKFFIEKKSSGTFRVGASIF